MEDTPQLLRPARRAGSLVYYVLGVQTAVLAFFVSFLIGAQLDYQFRWNVFYEVTHAVIFSLLLSPLALVGGILATRFARRGPLRGWATFLWSLVAGVGLAVLLWVGFLLFA